MNSQSHDTIVACCTPTGGTGGALAVIRISGPEALMCTNRIAALSSGKKLEQQPTHTVHHGFVLNEAGLKIDEVMFIVMRGPKTFTGEHTVEITCHQNPLIIEQIIQSLVHTGARIARRGEFSQQAVLNKKIDLMQAEAIHELIHAATEAGVRTSLAQLTGSMSSILASLEQRLITTIAWCEASFEFVEEVGDFGAAIKEQVGEMLARLSDLQRAYHTQTHIRDGIRIALIGPVNAGKSSLFNALIGRSRAIVTPIPGTTRDSIEASVQRGTALWTLIDTAGIRTTSDVIEQEGIARSWQAADAADVILIVLDSSMPLSETEQATILQLSEKHVQKTIFVLNKSDKNTRQDSAILQGTPHISVSTTTGHGIRELESLLQEKIQKLYLNHQLPFLVNQRHFQLLTSVTQELEHVLYLCTSSNPPYEIISSHLQRAVEILGEVSGKTVSEAAFDAVFREFCIGK